MAFANSTDTTNPGSGVGNRESLDIISKLIVPQSTPIYSLLPEVPVSARRHDWTVDKMVDPVTDGAVEGQAAKSNDNPYADLIRLDNLVQRWVTTGGVTKEQQQFDSVANVDVGGAIDKQMGVQKRNIEATLAGTQGASNGNGSSTGSVLRGLDQWINASPSADDATAVPADYRTPAASIHSSGNFTEVALDGILRSRYNEVGGSMSNNLHLIADTALRTEITEQFTRATGAAAAIRYMGGSGDAVMFNVSSFDSPFGMVDIITANPDCMPDRVNHDYGYILDLDCFAFGKALAMGVTMKAEDEAGTPFFIDTMGTLICRAPQAGCKITAIT